MTSFSNQHYIEKLKCVYNLIEVLEKAEYSHTEQDKKNSAEIMRVHKLNSVVLLEERIWSRDYHTRN